MAFGFGLSLDLLGRGSSGSGSGAGQSSLSSIVRSCGLGEGGRVLEEVGSADGFCMLGSACFVERRCSGVSLSILGPPSREEAVGTVGLRGASSWTKRLSFSSSGVASLLLTELFAGFDTLSSILATFFAWMSLSCSSLEVGCTLTFVRSLSIWLLAHELDGAERFSCVPNNALACVDLLGGLASLFCLFAGGGVSCWPLSLCILCSYGLSLGTVALPILAGVTIELRGLPGPFGVWFAAAGVRTAASRLLFSTSLTLLSTNSFKSTSLLPTLSQTCTIAPPLSRPNSSPSSSWSLPMELMLAVQCASPTLPPRSS